ncbi:MAG: hypothetical protein U9R19_12220 [Bacteroidota bacterium]|nr:hypothetical protein [Bacteroidota bacterium]
MQGLSGSYLQGEKRETVEHKLKIEFKHIIGKLFYINNFVFADPLKGKAYAHCTHPEEKSGRVQSSTTTLN